MEVIGFFQILGATLLRSGAVHLVQIAGIVWALQKLNTHPRRAKFTLFGLGLGLISGLITFVLSIAVAMLITWESSISIGMLIVTIDFISNLTAAVGLGLVVWAVFVEENS